MKDIGIDFEQVDKWLSLFQKARTEATKKKYKNLVIIACMPMVKQITYGFARRNTDPIEDLMQVGCIGLIKAVSSANIDKLASFKVYATQFIAGEIRHYIRDKSSMIKPPRKIQELAYRICRVADELTKENGKRPTDLEIAERLQMNVAQVGEGMAVERRSQVLSLDYMSMTIEDDGFPLSEKIPDEKEQFNQEMYEVRNILKVAIGRLKPELRQLVEMYYFDSLSQGAIAKELGMTNMQVSRKLKEAHIELYNTIQSMDKDENE